MSSKGATSYYNPVKHRSVRRMGGGRGGSGGVEWGVMGRIGEEQLGRNKWRGVMGEERMGSAIAHFSYRLTFPVQQRTAAAVRRLQPVVRPLVSQPRRAASIVAMSIFCIVIIALQTRAWRQRDRDR